MAFDKIHPGVKFGHILDIGCTIAYLINDDAKQIEFAVSYKHPKDAYNHKLGRQITQGRLLKGGHFASSIPFSEYTEAHDEGTPLNHGNIIKYLEFVRGTSEEFLPAVDVQNMRNR